MLPLRHATERARRPPRGKKKIDGAASHARMGNRDRRTRTRAEHDSHAARDNWTRLELDRLLAAHAVHGSRWRAIARLFPGRSDDSVRNAYYRTQRIQRRRRVGVDAHAVKKKLWTSAEKLQLVRLLLHHGKCWTTLQMPGRSSTSMKNQWFRILINDALPGCGDILLHTPSEVCNFWALMEALEPEQLLSVRLSTAGEHGSRDGAATLTAGRA